MNRFKLILPFLFISCLVYSQSDLPESIVNLELGIGQPYGGYGLKTVIGKNNSGILVGLGQFGTGMLGYTVGGQFSVKALFLNLNYGVVSALQINNGPLEQVKAASILGGGMIGFGSKKRLFLDLALGYSFGAKKTELVNTTYSNNVPCFNIGIGYRIPSSSKSKQQSD